MSSDLFRNHNATSDASVSVIEANKEFFDKATSNPGEESVIDRMLKIPQVREIYDDLTNEIIKAYQFDATKTRLLDFACGNGEMSLRLSSHCKFITGVDISQGMIDGFKRKVEAQNIHHIETVCEELKPESLNGEKFDIIMCLQAYHHMEDCFQITKLLKSFLNPGGTLLVVDLLKGTQHMPTVIVELFPIMQELMKNAPHSHHMLPHADGFSAEELHDIFTSAGLVDFEFIEAVTRSRENKVYTLFLAKGVNPI